MTKEQFYQLVAATGLDPRTLKRNGIDYDVAGDIQTIGVADNRNTLAAVYEQQAADLLKAAKALRVLRVPEGSSAVNWSPSALIAASVPGM